MKGVTKSSQKRQVVTLEKIGFDEQERKVLSMLEICKDYQSASKRLNKKANHLRQITYRLRLRYIRARDFVREYETIRRKLGKNKPYLNTGASK